MTQEIARAKKIEESRAVITNVEEQIGIPLTDARYALKTAAEYIDDGSLYVSKMVEALGKAAGNAIERQHDDLASEALQLAGDLEEVVTSDD